MAHDDAVETQGRKGNRKVKKEASKSKEKGSPLERYQAFCYRRIGKRLEQRDKEGDELLSERLKQANMKLSPAMFNSIMVMTVIISAVLSLSVSFLIMKIVLDAPSWPIFVMLLTGITSISTYAAFPFVVRSRIANRKMQIDRELPFTLSELSILASTGLSPIRVIRRIAKRGQNDAMASEFKKVIYKVDMEGKDIITALGEAAKETPSVKLRENLWDLANMIHQGGAFDEHLRAKADHTLQLKRDIQKEFIEKIAQYSDMYISLVLVSVLFIGIIAFLIDAMASDIGGIDASTLLLILTYLIIPASVLSVSVLVSTAYSRSEQ